MIEQRVDVTAVPWRGADTYTGMVLAILVSLMLLALATLFVHIGFLENNVATLATAGLLEGLLLALAWLFGVRKHRLSWRDLGFRTVGPRAYLLLPSLVLMAVLLLMAVYGLLLNILQFDLLAPPDIPSPFRPADGGVNVAGGALIVVWGPLAEEAFFRGFLLQGLIPQLGPLGAVLASSLLFAVSHGVVAVMVPAFISGVLFAWLFLRTRSLWPCFMAHAMQNSLAFSLAA